MKLMRGRFNCRKYLSKDRWVGIILWLVIVGVYVLSAARTMTGFGDSDELITGGLTASLIHPPGYPLLTGLIFVATHIPGIPPAVGAHLLAGLIMATSIWLIYSMSLEMGRLKKSNHDGWSLFIRASLGLIIATTGLLWEHGTHIEVFGLNGLLSLWFLRLTMKKPNWVWAVVGGIGLSHHQTFVLVWLPLVGWSLLSRQIAVRKWLWWLAMTVVGFVLGYGLIGIFAGHITDYSWKFTPTLMGLWQFYSRSDYSGYSPELGQLSAWWSGISIHKTIEALGFYLGEFWQHWGIFSLLGVVGILTGKKLVKIWYWPLLIGFLLSGPVLAGYLTLTDGVSGTIEFETSRAIVERMYVLGDMWWGVWVMVGGLILWQLIRPRWQWLVAVTVGVVALNWVGWRFSAHNLSSYRAAELYSLELTGNLPEHTRLVCLSDLSCFGTTYAQAVLGFRTDITLVSSAAQYRSFYVDRQPNLYRFKYPDNPYRIGELVGWSTYSGIPIAVAQLNAYWAGALGLNGEAFRLTPLPYSLAIVRDTVGIVPAYKPMYMATQKLVDTDLKYRYVEVLRAVLTEHHALAANLLSRMDNLDFAKREITAGLLLQPNNQILLSMQKTADEQSPDPSFQVKLTDGGYEVRIRDCLDRGDMKCALEQSIWLTWRNPDSVTARLELARSWEAVQLLPFAKREYQHVIELEPENQEAITALKRLKSVIDLGSSLF